MNEIFQFSRLIEHLTRTAINSFFSSWYTALFNAVEGASLIPDIIIPEIDPDKNTNYLLDDILTALSVGLAFLGIPEVSAALIGVDEAASVATKIAAGALNVGLQQAPGVAQAMWPQGTTSTQTYQIDALQQQLLDNTDLISNQINSGLVELMTNQQAFVAFASSGNFSGNADISVANDTTTLGLGLRTLIVSTALSQNHYQGIVNPTSIRSCNPDDDTCYTNSTTGLAFSLGDPQDHHGPTWTNAPLMTDILTNTSVTAQSLFQNSFQCASAGNFGTGVISWGRAGTERSALSDEFG
ncbi:hypothetical protein MMC28_011055 [Mycoblastus sanguinarius]|nr:hypothetical protein [Mycoblastus sanguinarius]